MAGYLEDIEVGSTFKTGRRTVTEADVVAFAGVSGDFNPLHTDEVSRASRSRPQAGFVTLGVRILSDRTGDVVQEGRDVLMVAARPVPERSADGPT
jgi:acyl dehydratase